jgi:hypothetical protein
VTFTFSSKVSDANQTPLNEYVNKEECEIKITFLKISYKNIGYRYVIVLLVQYR